MKLYCVLYSVLCKIYFEIYSVKEMSSLNNIECHLWKLYRLIFDRRHTCRDLDAIIWYCQSDDLEVTMTPTAINKTTSKVTLTAGSENRLITQLFNWH